MASLTDLVTRQGQMTAAPEVLGVTGNVQQNMPWWADAWSHWPGMTQFAGFTSWRAKNTILSGGWGTGAIPIPGQGGVGSSIGARGSAFYERFKMRYSPRSALRFSHMERLGSAGGRTWAPAGEALAKPGKGGGFWSPEIFQAGPMMNAVAIRAGRLPGLSNLPVFANMPRGQPLISGGFWPTVTSSYGLSTQGAMSAARASNVASFMRVSNPAMYRALGGEGFTYTGMGGPMMWGSAAQNLAGMTGTEASQVTLASARGSWNLFAGGAISAGRAPITNTAASAVERATGAAFMDSMYSRGASWMVKSRALGGVMADEGVLRTTLPGLKSIFTRGASAGVEEVAGKYAAREGIETAGRAVITRGLEQAGELAARTAIKDVAIDAAVATGERVGVRAGAGLAARFMGGQAIAAASGPAAPFVEAALVAWTVYDVAKTAIPLAKAAVKGAVNFEKDMAKSLQGDINKAPMSGWRGMGYTDTEVALTSRQRGVMAIQNSRLNARSVLGSEAGLMHGHFG